MKKIIRTIKNKKAVSEVLGTIFLLGVSVLVFSMLYVIVLYEPLETNEPYPDIAAFIEGERVIIEHRGGDSVDANNEFRFNIADKDYNIDIKNNLTDLNGDGKWNLGERLTIDLIDIHGGQTPYSLENSSVNITGLEDFGDTGRIILTGDLDITPRCDLGVKITVDNENPKIGENINITITVTNYHGDLDATGIEIKFKLPDGLLYITHNPIDYDYINETGIWTIEGQLGMRESISLIITAKVIGTQAITQPIQLAMILDGSGSISSNDWNTMRTGLANAVENSSVFPHDGSVELTVVQFGGNNWDANWEENSNWYRTTYQEHSGWRSVTTNTGNKNFICKPFITSDASYITVDFWYRIHHTENDDLNLYYFNGQTYNLIDKLGDGPDENQWLHYTDTITDPQYFINNFKIRFNSDLSGNEKIYIDDVLIKKDTTDLLNEGFEKTYAYSRVEIGPVLITDIPGDPGNYQDIKNNILTIQQMQGWTPLECGIRLAADQLYYLGDYEKDKRQIVNIVTDGVPNCEWLFSYSSDTVNNVDIGKTSSENAIEYMVTKLDLTGDKDEIDSLAVGLGGMYGGPDIDWLQSSIVHPQPGNIAPPYTPGWVKTIANWQEFENAMNEIFYIQFKSIKSSVTVLKLDLEDPNPNNDFNDITILPKD